MNKLAEFINSQLPSGYGFTLLVFTFGESGFMNYISNAHREDVKKALKEYLEVMEQEGN